MLSELEGNEDWCWKEDDVAKLVLELEGNGGGRGAVDTGGLSKGTEGGGGYTGRHAMLKEWVDGG